MVKLCCHLLRAKPNGCLVVLAFDELYPAIIRHALFVGSDNNIPDEKLYWFVKLYPSCTLCGLPGL